MEKYVLDTNIFFNMQAGFDLGNKTEGVVKTITNAIQKSAIDKHAEFYVTPRIVSEFLSFFDDTNQGFITEFLAAVITMSPDVNSVDISANIFAEYIEDCKLRNLRGITIAEEEMNKVAHAFTTKSFTEKKEFQIALGPHIRNMRERFRQATRYGTIDSLADFDLILLAKELGAHIVTADEGVIAWGRKIGIKEIRPAVFKERVMTL